MSLCSNKISAAKHFYVVINSKRKKNPNKYNIFYLSFCFSSHQRSKNCGLKNLFFILFFQKHQLKTHISRNFWSFFFLKQRIKNSSEKSICHLYQVSLFFQNTSQRVHTAKKDRIIYFIQRFGGKKAYKIHIFSYKKFQDIFNKQRKR